MIVYPSDTVPSESVPGVAIPLLRQVTLLREIEDRGLVASLDHSGAAPRLRLRGPGSRVTPDLQARIVAARDDLVADLLRREAFGLQIDLDTDAARSWVELELCLALAIEARHKGTLTREQEYTIGQRVGLRSKAIREGGDDVVERQTSDRFMLTTQERLATRNGVAPDTLTSIFRPPERTDDHPTT